MNELSYSEITRRLDLIIILMMKSLPEDKEPLMKKVKFLHDLNFNNDEIGTYLSKDKKQVAKLLYENKRKTIKE